MQLNDKVAIVTGAGRGIGKGIALAFAGEGAHIVAAARTAGEAETTAQEVRAQGRRALAVPTDVCKGADVQDLVDETLSAFGRIDILVNNAGIYGPIGPLVTLDPEAWLHTVAVNLGGPFLCCRAVLPVMMQQRSGKIINLSGGGATSPRPNFSAYAVSKTAVLRLTDTLAEEVKEYNIQVNAIAPGGVNTRLIDAVIAAGDAAGARSLEEARSLKNGNGTPIEEVVGLAVLLASDNACKLTGRVISARWDDWRSIPAQIDRLMSSDVYTLRRVVLDGDR